MSLAATLSFTASVAAADLAGRMREGGVDWIIGKWTATTDSGNTMSLGYEWGLRPTVVMSKFKSDDDESMAMIYLDESDGKVRHLAVGASGRLGKGEWIAAGGLATLKYQGTSASGEEVRLGFVHRKIDADTMEVDVRGLNSDGVVGDTLMTLTFKRQK
ncbi:MAG: hypothetical protein AB7O66_01455 [Limisphaerales bacterium]